jgi:lipopolysaccharide transport system permease protein
MTASLHLLVRLTIRDLQERYMGTHLGIIWLILQPLLMLLIYTFVFSEVLAIRFDYATGDTHIPYAFYVMSGLLAFNGFADALSRGSQVLLNNRHLLLNSSLPAGLLPLVPVLSSVVIELVTLVFLLLALLIVTGQFSPLLWAYPVLLLIRLCFSLAGSYVLSIFSVFVRDIHSALPMVLMLLMLLSPVFYPANQVPEHYQTWYFWNPLSHLLETYRGVLLTGDIDWKAIFTLCLFAMVLVMIARVVFKRLLRPARFVL